MAVRRDDYPIFNGRIIRDSRVTVLLQLDNNTDVKFEKVIKAGENAIEYVVDELNARGYKNAFYSGQVCIEGMSGNPNECILDISYNDKWIMTGVREVKMVQYVVYYPFESRGIAYEDVLKPTSKWR